MQTVDRRQDPARQQQRANDRRQRGCAREGEDLEVVVHVEHDKARRQDRTERQHDRQEGKRDQLQSQRRQQTQTEGGTDPDGECPEAQQDDDPNHRYGLKR